VIIKKIESTLQIRIRKRQRHGMEGTPVEGWVGLGGFRSGSAAVLLVVASDLFRKLAVSQPASSVSGNQGGGGKD
jgi:hypothetical protein